MATSSRMSNDDIWRRLECPVCHEQYRKPRMLPCGHTLCENPCLEQIHNGKPRMNCPECRVEHTVPESGITGFPLNVALSRVTDDTTVEEQAIKLCPICNENEAFVKCFHCDLIICEECKIEHTPKLLECLRQYSTSLGKDISEMKSACEKFVEDRTQQAEAQVAQVHSEIDAVAQKLKTSLDDRAAELKKAVDGRMKGEIETSSQQVVPVKINLEELSNFHERLQHDLNSFGKLTHTKMAKMKAECSTNVEQLSEAKKLMREKLKINLELDLDTASVDDAIQNLGKFGSQTQTAMKVLKGDTENDLKVTKAFGQNLISETKHSADVSGTTRSCYKNNPYSVTPTPSSATRRVKKPVRKIRK